MPSSWKDPIAVVLSNITIDVFGTFVPLITGNESVTVSPSVGLVMTGAAGGGVVSTVKLTIPENMDSFPTESDAVATIL